MPTARQRHRTAVRRSLRPENRSPGWTLIRKTSLLRIVPTACGQAADIALEPTCVGAPIRIDAATMRMAIVIALPTAAFMLGDCVSVATCVTSESRSDPTSSRCQISRARGKRARKTFSANEPSPPVWWSQTGSNRRPPACKAGALPTELWPRTERSGASGSPMQVRGGPGKI